MYSELGGMKDVYWVREGLMLLKSVGLKRSCRKDSCLSE